MAKKLLAKGNYKELSLEQHLIDTEIAARAIFKDRILDNWCRFFRVKDKERFLLLLRIAELFHDLGKANKEFQDMVEGKKEKQTLRHEWLSALILHCPNVRQWLAASSLDLDIDIITAAVLSHHLKAHPEYRKEKCFEPRKYIRENYRIPLYLNAENLQIKNIFDKIAEVAKIKEPLSFNFPQEWIPRDDFWEMIRWGIQDAADDFDEELEDDPARRSLLLAVKAGVIAADSVASGIFRTRSSQEIVNWVDENLHREPITSAEIEQEILQPLKEKIQKRKNKPVKDFKYKDFQNQAHLLGDLVLLLSACGSGKTLFGYKWFQAVVERCKVGHIIFLYPTRGTATEGFRDYLRLAPETDASLLTGTALYELQEMAKNPDELKTKQEEKDFTTEQRLFALGYWNKRFFSATVDQFLSFLTHSYSSLCLLPVLTDSVIVIDEVHSFSKPMFDNLISFLQHFDIPVLCMTATLPTTRREQLATQGLRIFPTPAETRQLEDLSEAEQHPRYDIQLGDRNLAEKEVIKALQNKQEQYRILWVVNTVDRCRNLSRHLDRKIRATNLAMEVLTYHSRFTLEDRSDRHKATVKAFSAADSVKSIERAIAVTTQVCEMSLDLDADIIITELAPISSLVQRMGRGNRHLKRGKGFRAKILVYEPEGIKPYQEEEIAAAREFINSVLGETSQAQLAEKLEQFSPKTERLSDGGSSFVDGGYYAVSEKFRGDEKDWTVNAVLKKDLPALKQLIDVDDKDKKPYDGYILPVPKYNPEFFIEENCPDWLPKYLKVADNKFYDEKRGFGEWKIN
ncbi:MAG: CRISPR-associated helicase Cas3' [Cyanobacteria bacterium P01_G01_bin.67]